MATQVASINRESYGSGDGSIIVVQWAPMAGGDVGAWVQLPEWADGRSVHIYGTFGTTPSVQIEGSNEPGFPPAPANAAILNDFNGNSMVYTSGATVLRALPPGGPLSVRPNCTAGTGTSLTVVLVARRLQPQIR